MLDQLGFVPDQVLYHQKDILEIVEVDALHMDLVADPCTIYPFLNPVILVVVVAVADVAVEVAVVEVEEVTALAI